MADLEKRLSTNVPGPFFVDATCINCDTCRQLAPDTFGEALGYSYVEHQPHSLEQQVSATRALISCPTGSIGTTGTNLAKQVIGEFPLELGAGVFYCGFNSPRSYGGNSYFIANPGGNWMVDSPKFNSHLVKRLRAMGGLKYIFLTHRDDIADASKYAHEFGAQTIIHEHDADALPQASIKISGEGDYRLGKQFLIIPTPGHTQGHSVLLYDNRWLFTGDHLAWDRETEQLESWPDYCWYDWEEQKRSLKKLLKYRFSAVLPGHGQRVELTEAQMHAALQHLVANLP